jgi:predicted ArsR family transcriptional regulator
MNTDTAPHNGRPTSKEAARIIAGHIPRLTGIILRALHDAGSMTREQIAHVTGLRDNTVRPRCKALIDAGRIVAKGTRPTSSGHPAEVLGLT